MSKLIVVQTCYAMLCYAKLTSVKRNACAKKCWLTLLKQTSPARSTQAFIVSSIMQIFVQILCRNRGKTGLLPRQRRSFANFFSSSKQTKKKLETYDYEIVLYANDGQLLLQLFTANHTGLTVRTLSQAMNPHWTPRDSAEAADSWLSDLLSTLLF